MAEFGDFDDEVVAVELKEHSGNFNSKTFRKEAVYNAPPGWTIRSHKNILLSSWGTTSFAVSQVAAESAFISETNLAEAYEFAIKLAGGDEEKKKALEAQMKNHLSSLYSITSSHYAIHAVIEAKGNGWYSDRTSQIHLRVMARIKYVGENNIELLKKQLISKFDLHV